MSKIDTSTWKEFVYTDLFDLLTVKNKLSKMDFSDDGKIPVYSSETTNNGILGYTNCHPSFVVDEKTPIYLVFGDHTKTMNIATESFCVMDNVKVLKPKINNVEQLLFITTVWKKSIPDLGYARHWSVAKDAKFKLPVTEIEEIDFEYMEARIKELEEARIKELEEALRVMGLHDTKLTANEEKSLTQIPILKTVKIGSLFEKVQLKGKKDFDKKKDVSKEMTSEFSLPLVNAKNGDNGIMYYGRESDFESVEMCLDIVNDGAISVGNVYPQPQKTGVLYNAYLVRLINQTTYPEVLIYLATVLQKTIKHKFSYDNKAGWEKVKEVDITLPFVSASNLDFEYMKNYILAIEKLAIQKLYDDKGILIDATKKIV